MEFCTLLRGEVIKDSSETSPTMFGIKSEAKGDCCVVHLRQGCVILFGLSLADVSAQPAQVAIVLKMRTVEAAKS